MFFIVLLLGAPVFCWGQGEGNVWHFGYGGGINFNSGSAVAVTGYVNTLEGSASICNSSGNLLFSTDGATVYNAIGGVMGDSLFGHFSSTQSALIVPFPGSNSNYYIFTSDAYAHPHGICYSVVNMNLNGGLGGLVSINTQLITPACEKITATPMPNGNGYWVVVHSYPTNEYYAYPVTSTGIGVPIISAIGVTIVQETDTEGDLKFSPNGLKLGAAIRHGVSSVTFELYDFDLATGIISNCLPFNIYNYPNGVSFSPDNSKLYIGINVNGQGKILQYDLTLANFQNFPYTMLSQSGWVSPSLQIAPDGKIYTSRYSVSTLGVINSPNLAGAACNFVDSGFQLVPGTAVIELPNFIDSYFQTPPCPVNLGPDLLICTNSPAIILNAGTGFSSYHWSNGNTNQSTSVIDTGSYFITVTGDLGCVAYDTIVIIQPQAPSYSVLFQTDSLTCLASGTGSIDIDATGGTGSYTYAWNNGATTQDLNNLNSGTYVVTVSDSIGCVVSNPAITIQLVNDMVLTDIHSPTFKCYGDSIGFIDLSEQNGIVPYSFSWSTGNSSEDLSGLKAGNYTVTVNDNGECTKTHTVVITQPDEITDTFIQSADTIYCSASGGTPGYYYTWSTGSIEDFIDSVHYGTYTVTISDHHQCVVVDTVTIPVPSFENGEINLIVYPSPTSDWLSISGSWLGQAKIEIIDVLGRIIAIYKNNNAIWSKFDVHNYAAGIYFLRVTDVNDATVVKKFVVVH